MNFHLFPEEASTTAAHVDALFWTLTALSAFVIALVFLPILYFVYIYRRGKVIDRTPPGTSSLGIELTWMIIPALMMLGVFAWASEEYFHMERPPADALEVDVIGKQWMWKIQHREGKREINELHVPVNRTIRLTMTSQDVIHDFFVPEFRTKQDVVPGRYTSEWFKPTKTGVFHIFCAQYCGTDHARMIGKVYVMAPDDYQHWLTSGEQGESLVAAGARLYRNLGCSGCHGASAQVHAPKLEGLYGKPVPLDGGEVVLADDKYIRDSILLPASQIAAGYPNIMPTFQGHVTEEELLDLIAYIKSLSAAQPPEEER